VNTSTTTHKGLDLLFADIPENLPVPNISTDVPAWNKLHESYYECLFAFAKSNLYDHGVLVLAHCASASVSKSIIDWAHTYDFYLAEDWFGMNDLDLQSPFNPSGVVSNSLLFRFRIAFHYIFISISFSLFQTRKFSIKVLLRVNSVLRVREEAMQEYGYNLQRDGWLNTFTDEKNQAIRSDGIPWRGAREKHHVFFSILFATLTDKNDVIMDWHCGVGTHSLSASSFL
jgi:hypothetical protein